MKALFESLEKRLSAYMEGRVYPPEIATTFNCILYDGFSKGSLRPVFIGEYFVDPANPGQTRVFCHQGTEACSPLPIKTGVIGRAIRTGTDQYVPDVTKDSDHIGCDPEMKGSELVLISWSQPYGTGKFRGRSVPLGVLDLDFNVKDALSGEDAKALRKIWDVYGKLIFPGEPEFEPKGGLFVRSRA